MYRGPVWLMLLFVGIVAPVAALVATFLSLTFFGVQAESTSLNYVWFYPAAAGIALVLGVFLWWLFIVKQKHVTPGWGIGVGIMTSLLAHPLTWVTALTFAKLNGNAGFAWLSMQEVSLSNVVGLMIFFTLASLVYVGWITTLVGGIFGLLLDRLFLKKANAVIKDLSPEV